MQKFRFLYIIICIAALSACNDESYLNDLENEDTIPKPVFIDITYNGGTANVSIPSTAVGVSCASGTNTDVVLTLDDAALTEYIYRVKGSSASGSLTINSNYKLTLLLAGVDLTSTAVTPAMHINCGKRVSVILQEGTENSFTDNASNDKKGAFYTKGHMEIEGGGTLNVTGKARHALCSKEYMQLKKTTGTINIVGSVGDGIHCGKGDQDPLNNYFKMSGGTLNFSDIKGDLIDCDDYGNAYISGGTLNLTVDGSDVKGLKADSIVEISGGTLNIDVSGMNAIGIQSNYATYCSGGTITGTVSGTNAIGLKSNISSSSYVMEIDDEAGLIGCMFLSGRNIDLNVTGSGSRGIRTDKDLTATGGVIALRGLSANSPGYKVKGTFSGSDYFSWTSTDE